MSKSNVTGAPRAHDARERIIRAAIPLFAGHGFRGTSSRNIARLADVSEVTVYRYFDNKEEIFWAAFEASLEEVKPRLDSLERGWKNESLATVLPQIITILVDAATYSPHAVRLIVVALMDLGPRARDRCKMYVQPLYLPIFTYLCTQRPWPASVLDPAMVTASILVSVLLQPEVSRFTSQSAGPELSRSRAVQSYSEFWLNALNSTHHSRPASGPGTGDDNSAFSHA